MKKLNQILIACCVVTTCSCIFIVILFLRRLNKRQNIFNEIITQRIKIIEPDGTVRITLSNHAKFPGLIIRNKEEKFERPQAGILFYNDEGSENGGLIFGGSKNNKGEIVNSGGSLSFDRYGGNQEVQLIGVNDNEDKFAGLRISDSHPVEHKDPSRIWVGRDETGNSEIALMDAAGKKRLLIQVKSNGQASINFLDEKGKVIKILSPPIR